MTASLIHRSGPVAPAFDWRYSAVSYAGGVGTELRQGVLSGPAMDRREHPGMAPRMDPKFDSPLQGAEIRHTALESQELSITNQVGQAVRLWGWESEASGTLELKRQALGIGAARRDHTRSAATATLTPQALPEGGSHQFHPTITRAWGARRRRRRHHGVPVHAGAGGPRWLRYPQGIAASLA